MSLQSYSRHFYRRHRRTCIWSALYIEW